MAVNANELPKATWIQAALTLEQKLREANERNLALLVRIEELEAGLRRAITELEGDDTPCH